MARTTKKNESEPKAKEETLATETIPAPSVSSGTLEPTMEERIVTVIAAAPSRSLKWWQLVDQVGDKARGACYIQLHDTGLFDANVKVWYGVSIDFQQAVIKLRAEKRIRFFAVSPVGYFPAAMTPPISIAYDYRIAYNAPHLFLTEVELSS